MAKKSSKSAATRKAVSKPRKRSGPGKGHESDKKKEAEAYTRSLVAHGQAVKVPAGGKLPSGATHELVEDADGTVRPVRRRFSLL
jgi:hypothetical protein